MRYLSVCSGIEAVSVAWAPLGWQPAMFAEIEPFCAWLLHSRYGATRPIHMPSPDDAETSRDAKHRAAAIRNVAALPADGSVINAGDFTHIGAEDVGAIDLLAGGTPSQSFSVAGKRAGLDDSRGNLTIEFARLADRLRPLWLVWENVPGVLSIDDGRTFGAFLGMLVECGYGVAYRVLNAQYFGVPQRRRRVFVVGRLGDWRAAAAVFLERESLSGYPPPRREAREGIARGVEVGFTGGRFTDTAPTLDAGCKDGYLASRTQSRAIAGGRRALRVSRALGIFVVVFSFGLGGAELLKVNIDRIALPLGCVLFAYLVALRIWSARDQAKVTHPASVGETGPNTL